MEVPAGGEHPPVAAAVIVHDGRVLLVRRRVEEGRLSWQFAAGKVEQGESTDVAAVRETLEEVGLVVRACRALGIRVHPDTSRVMYYVACEIIEGSAFVAATDEITEVAWCDHATLAGYVGYALYGPVRKYLEEMLR